MSETRMIEAAQCPFLRPMMVSDLGAFPMGVYCRLPSGRIRIPSRDELARFCSAGHHHDCPVYRRARYREIEVAG